MDNAAASAVSRSPAPLELSAISFCTPKWLAVVTEGYQQYEADKELLQELALTGSNDKGYTLHQGVIRYKDRIWLGHNKEAQKDIILSLHDSVVGVNSGFQGTYQRIKGLFAWPALKQDIQAYVQACVVCKQAKSEHIKKPGLLSPLPIPKEAWNMVSMDFIGGLPKSKNFDTILVVIDKFSKYGHFIPLCHPFTALQVAQIYVDNIYKLHGLPQVLVTDRDPIFTSNIWQELCKLTDTKMNMSSANHPQTDGQTEKLNQCLETFLRCLVHSTPKKWAYWLSQAEYWYNTNYHSALGTTPFQVLYGYQPRHLGIANLQSTLSSDLSGWLAERNLMQGFL